MLPRLKQLTRIKLASFTPTHPDLAHTDCRSELSQSPKQPYDRFLVLAGRYDFALWQKGAQSLMEQHEGSPFSIDRFNGPSERSGLCVKLAHQNCYDSNIAFNNQSDYYYKDIISNYFNQIKFVNEFEQLDFNNQNHIFIIGLPRSGSTLVETIIAHNEPKINSVGEFHAINTSILDQIGKKIYSKDFDHKNHKLSIDKKKF